MDHEPHERQARRRASPARRLALAHEGGDEHAVCAACKTPPFRAFGDHVALRAWILEYRKELAAELRDYCRKNPELHARPDHWFAFLTAQLRSEVAFAWEQSQLATAHGIPPARLGAPEHAHAAALRAFVDDGFVALLCAQCRTAQSRAALTPHALRSRYAAWFFDGDAHAAQTLDPVRWTLLHDAIAFVCSERAAASEG